MFAKNFTPEPLDSELEAWLQERLGREVFSPKEGRLEKFFSSYKTEFERQNVPIITVAGTNGKGEVVLALEYLFTKEGHHPFLWMSPHIISVRERFSQAGFPISCNKLLELFEKFSPLCEELSYYEFLFLCFCEWVKENLSSVKRPLIIFEVGLGGRLDATNFFDCHYAALISVGRDHMEFLGPTLQDVLREKAAIGRKNRHFISAMSQAHLQNELKSICDRDGYKLTQLEIKSESDFKERNKEAALEIFKAFLGDHGIPGGGPSYPQKLWARPFEVTYKSTQFILIGSHNLDGLRHLAKWVNRQNIESQCDLSSFDELWVGMSRKPGADLDQCLQLIGLSPCLGKEVVLFEFEHPRSTPLIEMEKSWDKVNQGRKVRFEKSWQQSIVNLQGPKKILVCGSYYFVGELLRKGPFKEFF